MYIETYVAPIVTGIRKSEKYTTFMSIVLPTPKMELNKTKMKLQNNRWRSTRFSAFVI